MGIAHRFFFPFWELQQPSTWLSRASAISVGSLGLFSPPLSREPSASEPEHEEAGP